MYQIDRTTEAFAPEVGTIMNSFTLKRWHRDAAVVTAVHVARDWAIEQMGDRYGLTRNVAHYMVGWLTRNGASLDTGDGFVISDLVDAVWALAELPQQDPLTLIDDDYHGTSDEARAMLTAQYERDLTHALSRITWKD